MHLSSSARSRTARTSTMAAVAVAAAGVTLAGAPSALAIGESGDIDVRSVSWHSTGDRDGVEVCKFVLVASNFETLESVTWLITEKPRSIPPNTLSATLPLVNGKARSQEYLLPEGTYKLEWPVGGIPLKNKSFSVDCSQRGQGGPNGGRPDGGRQGSSSASDAGRSTGKSAAEIYDKPSGAVLAGGGGVPDMEGVSSESEAGIGTSAALVAGAAGIAGLIMVRRSARRRARNEA
ncbi:hypothetical protein AB0K86_24800 [Streptomyces clavifer]|uniref:hypothetical protein n=1 Tax=Streptomyces TaxID=1883 RepID=UPI0006F51B76|nr:MULTISPECIES: hypothetical protein [unclassified Streptomyces]KQX86353.1 hypothetical protein ASD26_27775 [Streptomyces sp. Root1319]KQZ16921.1 hypothetical protein ASD51_04120 [Streptomyces sp. Root55]MDX3061628.1 hypothetical protein [Streptomyces sp. ND04-05B]